MEEKCQDDGSLRVTGRNIARALGVRTVTSPDPILVQFDSLQAARREVPFKSMAEMRRIAKPPPKKHTFGEDYCDGRPAACPKSPASMPERLSVVLDASLLVQ